MKADAALEGPGGRDGGAGDRAIEIGVEHDAVVRTQQIGRTDRIGAHGERRPLDQRPAGAEARIDASAAHASAPTVRASCAAVGAVGPLELTDPSEIVIS